MKILKFLRTVYLIIYQAINNLIDHGGVEHAGYMAFITLISFFPFIIFLMAVAGFLGSTEHGIGFVSLLLEYMPPDIAHTLKPRVEEIIKGPSRSLLTLSILSTVWTSSSAVEGLRTILNKIYHVVEPPNYFVRRMFSILLFFIIIAIIFASTFLLLFFPVLLDKITNLENYMGGLAKVFNFSIFTPLWKNLRSFTYLVMLFFSMMFIYFSVPNAKVTFKSLIPGSLLTVILFVLSGKLLTVYVYNFAQMNLVYGSLAGVVITMLFFYIVNIIIIFGAEINFLLRKLSQNITN